MADRVVKVRLSAEVAEYARGMQEAADKTRAVGAEAERLAQRREAFNTLGTTAVAVGGAMTALSFAVAKTGIEYNTLQQTSRAALTTLLGSAEAANAQMDKLDEFARTSPFSKAVFIEAQQQLLGFGMAADQVLPTLDAIQQAVAATGGSNQDIAELTRIIAQLAGGVKLSAETLNQFGTRGIDAAQLIGDAMGKTGAQIREEITAGTIDADAAIKALTDGMQARFGGAADNVKQTYEGAMDRVKAAWRDVSADLMRPLVDPNGGGALVDLLNWAADIMRSFQRLPEPIKATSGALFAIIGVITLVGGTALLAVPKIVQFRLALQQVGGVSGVARSALGGLAGFLGGPWGIALMAATLAVSAFVAAHEESRRKIEAYAGTMADALGEITQATKDMVVEALAAKNGFLWMEQDSAYDAAQRLGIGLDLVTEAALGNAEAQKELKRQIDAAEETLAGGTLTALEFSNASVTIQDAVNGEASAIEKATEVTRQKSEADLASVESSEAAAGSYSEAAMSAEQLQEALAALVEEINGANSVGADAISSNIAYQDALAKVDEQIRKATEGEEGYSATLDQNTQAGRDNMGMLLTLADRSVNAAQKQFELDGNTRNYRATLEAGRQALIDRAQQLGYNAEEAGRLADQIFRIPDSTRWEAQVELDMAQRRLDGFFIANNGRRINIGVDVSGGDRYSIAGTDVAFNADGGFYDYAKVQAFAGGGITPGIFSGRQAGIHKFAEPETVWEAYVSGKPDQRHRNIGVVKEAGRRLGVEVSEGRGPVSVTNNYTFPGQYAMTAPELMRAAEKKERRANRRSA